MKFSKIKNQTKKLLAIKFQKKKCFFNTRNKNKSDLLSIKCLKLKDLKEAINYIKKSDQKIFLITGSLYLVGKLEINFYKLDFIQLSSADLGRLPTFVSTSLPSLKSIIVGIPLTPKF